jgi:hypothetical protein
MSKGCCYFTTQPRNSLWGIIRTRHCTKSKKGGVTDPIINNVKEELAWPC